MKTPEQIAAGLTEAQREAVLHCERDGNGTHIWAVHGLVKQGLMSLMPVPELLGVPAYRLNDTGLAVRDILLGEQP